MRFSEAKGRKVVSTSTADSVGKVHGFVVDPKARRVLALNLSHTDSGDTLRWADVASFGADAVTVSSADTITEPGADVAALSGKEHEVVGKRILSSAGEELGEVSDVEFDVDSGAVTTLLLADGEIDGGRLVGVGSYAVIVKAGRASDPG